MPPCRRRSPTGSTRSPTMMIKSAGWASRIATELSRGAAARRRPRPALLHPEQVPGYPRDLRQSASGSGVERNQALGRPGQRHVERPDPARVTRRRSRPGSTTRTPSYSSPFDSSEVTSARRSAPAARPPPSRRASASLADGRTDHPDRALRPDRAGLDDGVTDCGDVARAATTSSGRRRWSGRRWAGRPPGRRCTTTFAARSNTSAGLR